MLWLPFAGVHPTISSMSKKHKGLVKNLKLVVAVLALQAVAAIIFWQWGAGFGDKSAAVWHKAVSYGCTAIILLVPLVAFFLRDHTPSKSDASRSATLALPVLIVALLLAWPVAAYCLSSNHFTPSTPPAATASSGRVASAASKPKDNCITSVIILQRNTYQFSDYAKVISKYGSASDEKYLNKLPATIDDLANQCHDKKLSLKQEKSQLKQLSEQFKARGQAVLATVSSDKLTDNEKALR